MNMGTEKKENGSCDADYHPMVSGRNKVGHIFQLMGIMKEKRISGRVSQFEQGELRGYMRDGKFLNW